MKNQLTHKFVKNIPRELEDETVYVSIEYATAIHKCCCGCGNEVVTPISPTDWKLTFDGETISLYPSIGNWGLKCQSHYWIVNNRVKWAPKWSKKRIEYTRNAEELEKEEFYKDKKKRSMFRFFKKK